MGQWFSRQLLVPLSESSMSTWGSQYSQGNSIQCLVGRLWAGLGFHTHHSERGWHDPAVSLLQDLELLLDRRTGEPFIVDDLPRMRDAVDLELVSPLLTEVTRDHGEIS